MVAFLYDKMGSKKRSKSIRHQPACVKKFYDINLFQPFLSCYKAAVRGLRYTSACHPYLEEDEQKNGLGSQSNEGGCPAFEKEPRPFFA
jgi:hypothetical protein